TRWNIPLRDAGYVPWSRPPNEMNEIDQQTYGATLRYEASARWNHQLTVGFDGNEFETYLTGPRYTTPADTLLTLFTGRWGRRSARYTTTFDLPLGSALGT